MVGFIKPKPYDGRYLEGYWYMYLKVDGVNATYKNGQWVSRNGNPLKGLLGVGGNEGDVVEVFAGDWESSVSVAKKGGFDPSHMYTLYPNIDDRLFITSDIDFSSEELSEYLSEVNADGHEGIVITNGKKSFKLKPVETYDVPVTGIQMGTGKYEGMMGALITPMGKVGTGFTDLQRDELASIKLGTTIEVECMSLTPAGKFRHPRFVRVRWDK
jgi:hypothetical protein